jgi:hypothetical protein
MDLATAAIVEYLEQHPHDASSDIGIKITLHRGGGGGFSSQGECNFICDTVSTEAVGLSFPELTTAERKLLDNAVDSVVEVLELIRNSHQ